MIDKDKQETENLKWQREENDRKEKELEQREKELFAENSRQANKIAALATDEQRDVPVIMPSAPTRRSQRQRTDSEASVQSVSRQEFQTHFGFSVIK